MQSACRESKPSLSPTPQQQSAGEDHARQSSGGLRLFGWRPSLARITFYQAETTERRSIFVSLRSRRGYGTTSRSWQSASTAKTCCQYSPSGACGQADHSAADARATAAAQVSSPENNHADIGAHTPKRATDQQAITFGIRRNKAAL
jgi:hypothetical protein